MTKTFLILLMAASAIVPAAVSAQQVSADARTDWRGRSGEMRGEGRVRADRPQQAQQQPQAQPQAQADRAPQQRAPQADGTDRRGYGGDRRDARQDRPDRQFAGQQNVRPDRGGNDGQVNGRPFDGGRGDSLRNPRQDYRTSDRSQFQSGRQDYRTDDRSRFQSARPDRSDDGRPGYRGDRGGQNGWQSDRNQWGQGAQGYRGRDRNDDRQSYGRGNYNDRGTWNRGWRNDNRYAWNDYRTSNRGAYRLPRYYAPSGWGYGYRRFGIGVSLNSVLFDESYWIQDPYNYRLPDAYGPYRWVRYYNDALLVDLDSGRVVDTVYDIFW